MTDFPELMTTAEVAPVLRLTAATVSRMCNRGEFPGAVKPGKSWLIPASDVESLLRPPVAPDEPAAFRNPREKRLAKARGLI